MNRRRSLLTAALVSAVTAGLALAGAGSASATSTPITQTGAVRLAGADRYATAVKVSQRTFKAPQTNLVVASGESWPDALAAGPFAASLDAPLLLVRKNSAPQVAIDELKRLRPSKVYVIGGPGAISDATWNKLMDQMTWESSSERIAGRDRYATAFEVLNRMDGLGAVYVASGATYADALAGGAAAAAEGGALVLTPPTSLSSGAAKGVGRTNHVVILGGTGAVSAGVERQIRAAAGGATVDRADGANRYETAAIVADALWGSTGADAVFFASGTSFPDALGATPAAYVNDASVLLTRGTCTPEPTAVIEEQLAPRTGVFLGGASVTYSGARLC
jgi:putative cell wall-binding protein